MRIVFLILMLLCLIYAISIFLVGSGTLSFLIWIAGAAVCFLAWFLAGHDRWQQLPGLVRGIAITLLSIGIILCILCSVAQLSHFRDHGPEDGDLDYLIVLGAQMRENGPSVVFRFRLDAACDYLTQHPDTVCIVSGARGHNESVSEGEGGAAYLISRGIDPERVIPETEARDTRQNIACSLQIMTDLSGSADHGRIGIVTNNYHLFRGIHLAMAQTQDEIYGIAARTLPWYLPNNMARECFGILRDLPRMRF